VATLIPHAEYAVIVDDDDSEYGDGEFWGGGLSLYLLFGGERPEPAKPRRGRATATQPPAAPPLTPAPVAPVEAAPAPPPAPAAPAPAPLREGETFTFRKPTQPLTRPVPNAEPAGAFDAGANALLKMRMVNTDGAWWYVEGAVRGWIRERDLK
jgi:hypothetical protein